LQKKTERTRQRLRQAALTVFTERGVDAATVEEITEKADLGKGTLYRHFGDKYELVISLVEEALDSLIERINCYDTPPQNLQQVLDHVLTAHYQFFIERTEEFILLFQGRVLVKLQRETAGNLETPYIRYLEQIEKQVAPFVSRKTDPAKIRRLTCAVAGFVFGFFSFAMTGMSWEEIEMSVKPLRRVFVRSLCSFIER
jgi:AcrR family transcriptional regulator